MSSKKNNIKVNSEVEIAGTLPREVVVIPIVNSPIFPGMIAPIILSEDKYTSELDMQVSKSGYVALNLVKFKESEAYYSSHDGEEGEVAEYDLEEPETQVDDLTSKDIYRVGVLCKVVKKLKLPDGSVNLLVHGLKRYRITSFLQEAPLIVVKTEVFDDIHEADEELDAYTRSVINQVKKLSEINPYFNEEMKLAMLNSPSPGSPFYAPQ